MKQFDFVTFNADDHSSTTDLYPTERQAQNNLHDWATEQVNDSFIGGRLDNVYIDGKPYEADVDDKEQLLEAVKNATESVAFETTDGNFIDGTIWEHECNVVAVHGGGETCDEILHAPVGLKKRLDEICVEISECDYIQPLVPVNIEVCVALKHNALHSQLEHVEVIVHAVRGKVEKFPQRVLNRTLLVAVIFNNVNRQHCDRIGNLVRRTINCTQLHSKRVGITCGSIV